MKLSVITQDIQSILNITSKITAKTVCGPDFISCIHLSCEDAASGLLTVRACDGETDFVTKTSATVMEAGALSIPARLFKDIVATIKDLAFAICEDDSLPNSVKVAWSNGHCVIPKMNVDFPRQEEFDESTAEKMELSDTILLDSIRDNSFAAGDATGMRPVMECVHVSVSDGTIESAASNTSILSFSATRTGEGRCVMGRASMNIPSAIIPVLSAMLAGHKGGVSAMKQSGSVRVTSEDSVVTFRCVAGKYPPYKTIIPKETSNRLAIDRDLLLSVVRRLSSTGDKAVMRMNIDPSSALNVTFSSEGAQSSSLTESMNCDYTGEGMEIFFPTERLASALGGTRTKAVHILFQGPRKPALIRPTDPKEGQQGVVVMPCSGIPSQSHK